MSPSSHYWHSGIGGLGRKKGCLFSSKPPTHCLSLTVWAQDSRHLLIPSASANVYPTPLDAWAWSHLGEGKWGGGWSGSWLHQSLHMDSGRWKENEGDPNLLLSHVYFHSGLVWDIFLNVLGSQFYWPQGCVGVYMNVCVWERERKRREG